MKPRPLLGYLVLGSAGTTLVGFGLGWPWLLPILGAAIPYVPFLRFIHRGEPVRAFRWVLVWALIQSVAVVTASTIAPDRAAQVIHNGPPYAAEMIEWIETGIGPEGSPALYLPIHARHFLGFSLLSVLTFGAGALALGTWLLNYMNFYVFSLIRVSADPLLAAIIGWHPWAVIRVAGFVAVGAALTSFSLSIPARIRRGARLQLPGRLLAAGIGLVVLDALLKAALAPTWRDLLLIAVRGS